jgi:hypothetical protein
MIIDFRMPGGNATIRRDGLGLNVFLEKAPSPGGASLSFPAGRAACLELLVGLESLDHRVGAAENPWRVESEPKNPIASMRRGLDAS